MKKMLSLSVACAALMLSACGAEDYFNTENGEAYREKYTQDVKNEFRTNFEEKFGKISSTQTWDFAGSNVQYGPATRANGPVVSEGKEETFSKEFRAAIAKILPEGKDNHAIGGAYTLISQGPFDIYPLYHGKCMQWDLYVNDVKVGSYEDIMAKLDEFEFDKEYVGIFPFGHFESTKSDRPDTGYGEGKTVDLTTTGWHIDLPKGTPIFIKLVVTKSDTGGASIGQYAKNGDMITSVYNPAVRYKSGTLSNGSLILPWEKLSVQKPANLDQIIMFEDAKTSYGDADFNDFVLGIKGREVTPSPIDVITDENSTTYKVSGTQSKRYMIEDLGATDDFDYNDVVVDVTVDTIKTHTVTTKTETKYQNGKVVGVEETVEDKVTDTKINTTAIIRALGGTLDFNLTIGTSEPWSKRAVTNNPYAMWNTGTPTSAKDDKGHAIYDGTNIDWNAEEYVITGIEGWTPENNAISIDVYQNRMSDAATTSINSWSMHTEFPAAGETPFIIAVPVTQKWAVERKPFTDLENYLKK